MSEWREYKLCEFIDINPSTPLQKGTSAIKVSMEHLSPNSKRIINWDTGNYSGGAKFVNGDTLLARITPCLENGKIGYVDILKDGEVAFGSTEFLVFRERPGVSDSQFIFYFTFWNDFRDLAVQLMTGTSGRQRIETDALKLREFTFPTVPTQRAIAEVLSSLDDKIDLLTRQNTTLEALAQTYFRQWFVEDSYNNENTTVSQFADIVNNSINPARQPLEPFHHYSIPAFDNAQTPIIELGKSILSNKFIVLPNTVLVSKLNPDTPRIWLIGEKVQPNSICSTEFQVLVPNEHKYIYFIYCLMKSYMVIQEFAQSATGTSGSHQRIRPEQILQVEIAAPNSGLLIDFNELCHTMFMKIEINKKQIQTLQKLRDTLLPKLISGEVKIKAKTT